MKIGLLAGGGDLPRAVLDGANRAGHEIFLGKLTDENFESDTSLGQKQFSLGEFGKISKVFKKVGVTHICLAGYVDRPDFSDLKPDFKTLTKLPGALLAAKKGDDALLRYVIEAFEQEGFKILSPQELSASLLMPAGHLGAHRIEDGDRADAEKAMKTAREIGAMDIGQAAVVCRGVVLAVEAQEGTDAMLQRVATLPENLRGNGSKRVGVLAKMVKPDQDKRVDLPTIGPRTVELAAEAGLAGIIVEAEGALVLGREELIERANEANIFVVGLPPLES
ncbi:MAG: UDP-2,3-diacylglucosamine diphosphatase LpxI [Hellea sp.]|nr:UDP-2,3-diacylglucosamine diphosphatase LpxI [Hellea sp.]